MPIEKGMMGMMNLITTLGGYTVTAAKTAGRLNAAAFSPATALNLIPKAEIKGDPYTKEWWVQSNRSRGLVSHNSTEFVPMAYRNSSSGGSGSPRGSTTTSTTQRTRRVGSKLSHRPSRRPSSVRRRKRCPPGFKRVGNRCVPVRKGGRRRY